MEDATLRHFFKIIIAEAGLFMVFFWHLVTLGKITGLKRVVFNCALVLLSIAAVAAYFEFGWQRYDQYMNPHDCYHYHMGAKYSQEHKYFDLYRCSVIADNEMRAVYKSPTIRNLNTHSFESVASVISEKDQYKSAFTPERWEEFCQDIRYWQSVMPAYKWNAVLRDKGYNATPVWNSVAHFLTNHIPVSNEWGMRFLTYIDLACLAVMFLFVWLAFGWQVMLFAVIFHGINYFMAFVHIKGAFMRLDWVCLLVIGMCLLKLRWYKSAGVAMAYAAMARVFPLLFAFGLGAKLLWDLFHAYWKKIFAKDSAATINRDYWAFFVSFGVTCVALVIASAMYNGGFGLWDNFIEKIKVHDSDISTTRVGFKYIFLWSESNKLLAFEEGKLLWWSIMAGAVFLTGLLARKVEDYETVALSFIPVFFLAAPTFYYYVMLIVPLFLFLPRVKNGWRAIGAALFFLLAGVSFATGLFLEHHFQLFFILSCCVMAIVFYMALTALTTRRVIAGDASVVTGHEIDTLKTVGMAQGKMSRPVPSDSASSWWPFFRGLIAALVLGGVVLAGLVYLKRDHAVQPVPSESITDDAVAELVFVGDVMLSRNVARTLRSKGQDFTYPFRGVSGLLQGADVAFCNLESPISGRGKQIDKKYVFNAPPEAVDGLAYAGFDLVSLANNHILDFGPQALEDTILNVESKGIRQLGLVTDEEPQTPLILEANGLKIGFLAYCDPVPRYSYAREFYVFNKRPAEGDEQTLARDVSALKPQVDIVVVSIHWGIEYEKEPNEHQTALGRFIIDQGANIVAGHHQHVQQEPEVYNGGLIINGMGNFVFDQRSRPATRESRLYRVEVTKDGVSAAEYLPMDIPIDDWQPQRTDAPAHKIPIAPKTVK